MDVSNKDSIPPGIKHTSMIIKKTTENINESFISNSSKLNASAT
jgi:hypothetical protein